MTLKPGQAAKRRERPFDAKGRFMGQDAAAAWTLAGLKGAVAADGTFTPAADAGGQAGTIKATVGALSGEARATVARPLPWTETFESYADGAVPPGWINVTAGRMAVATRDGPKG